MMTIIVTMTMIIILGHIGVMKVGSFVFAEGENVPPASSEPQQGNASISAERLVEDVKNEGSAFQRYPWIAMTLAIHMVR